MTGKPLQAAAYARISDDRQGEALGVKRQMADIRDLVARRGGTVVLEQTDNDMEASTGKTRPGYAAVMAAVERGDINVICVWQTSRLWRNRRERAEGIELL
ncbi:MAG TPA: recombinase family protein, partial [Pilimelia sp.]|nr:recombinase family protein [Pilimelia sp.]